jgi:PAS domain S-box-containing protein
LAQDKLGSENAHHDEVRVLMVDDNADHVLLTRRLLSQSRNPKFKIESTGDPDVAISRILKEPFDAILLDFRLPGRNGLDVLREVNKTGRKPIIILTGQGDERTAVDFFHAGAYDYLLKTMDRGFGETLRLTIRELLTRRKLEEVIEHEKLRGDAIIESLTQMVCTLDLDLNVRGSNAAFRALLHRFQHPESPDEWPEDPTGLSAPDLVPDPVLREILVRKLHSVISRSQRVQEEIELVIDGQPLHLWVLAVPLRVARVTEGVVLSFTDLTEQRRVLHRQLRLARAVDASLDGVVITDKRGRIEYVNPSFTHMTGYEPSELLGRRSRFLQCTPGNPHAGRALRESLSGGEEWQGEVVNRKKDGGTYIADMTISPIRDDAGQVLGFVSTERDVTERRLFTDELIKARETAEENLRAKDMFLATVSHELRTPLTSIIGFADLLLMDPNLSGNGRAFAESILRAGRLLKQLIGNFLDFSRFAAGRFYLDLEPLPLRETLEEVLEMVRSEAAEKVTSFSLEINPGLPESVVMDRMKLQQVLLNLLSNAVKYADGGDVGLSVAPLFQPSGEGGQSGRAGGMLVFSVIDRGPGIPDEQRERIFEAFVQLEAGVARRRGGTGLGLAICRRLVELMGGTIWVDARPGGGSRFSFTIPMGIVEGGVEAGDSVAADRAPQGPLLLVHRIASGPIPGGAELSSWGYRPSVTMTLEELQHALEEGEPFACIVSSSNELSGALGQIAATASLAGDRVPWFLFAQSFEGASIPLGRVVPVTESLGPRAVVRLMRALDSYPPGKRLLLVDPEDKVGTYWAQETLDQRGLRVVAATPEEVPRLVDAEDVVVLLLDLMRDPHRACKLWREVADRAPRLLLALRYPRVDRHGWAERLDMAFRANAGSFDSGASIRLRWTLNALHTCAAQGRIAGWTGFGEGGTAPSDGEGPIARPRRPILVVEDHPENLQLVCRMLESLGLPFRSARDGRKALDVARRECPSLVLMDIQLPEMDGYQVTRAIRRTAGREHVPVVAMTAHVGSEDRRRCHGSGCVDFLPKPIERGDLVRILKRWLPAPRLDSRREARPRNPGVAAAHPMGVAPPAFPH